MRAKKNRVKYLRREKEIFYKRELKFILKNIVTSG